MHLSLLCTSSPVFFTWWYIRNHKCYLLELFHINVKYILSHYFPSRTSDMESQWYPSHAFIWKVILGGWNVIILKLCLNFHFLIPFTTIHTIFLHAAFPLLCKMTSFFPKENLQLIFKGSTVDLSPISFWHRPQRIDLQKLLLTLYIQMHSSEAIGSSWKC